MKWLADENFDNDIIRGILLRVPEFDIIRVQDIPQISGKDDPAMLAWSTTNGRVVLTHDLSTMIPATDNVAYALVRAASRLISTH